MQPRPPQSRSHYVDERPHRQDTRPAFVPGTVWGTASIQNLPVEIGAVLTRKSGRHSPLCPPRTRTLSSRRHAQARHGRAATTPNNNVAVVPVRGSK